MCPCNPTNGRIKMEVDCTKFKKINKTYIRHIGVCLDDGQCLYDTSPCENCTQRVPIQPYKRNLALTATEYGKQLIREQKLREEEDDE